MGGGGGAGGGGGGSGSGGDGSASASGDGSPENAEGDGASAPCGGGGGPAGCTNCSEAATRGDPVDVVTGRVFTVPVTDVFLPGPLPFELERTYSSTARGRDVGLGYGWSHSFAWEVVEHRDHVIVWRSDGTFLRFPGPIGVGLSALGNAGWVLRRETWGYVLIDRLDTRWRIFSAEVADTGGARFLLTAVQDRNENRIALTYEDGRLVELVDSAGRVVRVRLDQDRRIAEVSVKNAAQQGAWTSFARYGYDDRGDLVDVTDADGHTRRYAYADHLLTETIEPTGIRFHYRYDAQRRCVETWGDYDGDDASLAPDVPTFLYDHATRAKGVLHCKLEFGDDGYVEVVDSVQVQRFFGNAFGKVDKGVSGSAVTSRTYDAQGNVLSVTDPLGAVTLFERDARGRLVKKTDPLGRTWRFERDDNGRVVRIVDPRNQETRFSYDNRGNLLQVDEPSGNLLVYQYDRRGLVTEAVEQNGARTKLSYDEQGNRVEVVSPNGGRWVSTYDHLGQRLAVEDPLGGVTRFSYSRRGDLLGVHHADGGVTRYEWDGRGRLVRATDPGGRSIECRWAGHDALVGLVRPHGQSLRLQYNREGWLVTLENEKGEQHRIVHDGLGRPIEQTSFDASTRRYRYDLVGRLVRYENGERQVTDYEYDLAGELTKRVFFDGEEEAFEYDELGLVKVASTSSTRVELERDVMGSIVRDVQRVGDEVHFVESAYGPLGTRSERRTSVGHHLTMDRDDAGLRSRVELEGRHEVHYRRDATGQVLSRVLPRGGRIDSEFDPMGRLTRRSVFGPGARAEVPAGQPDWVGPVRSGATADVTYRYDAAGELVDRWDQDRGSVRYEYDPLGQILAAIPQHARPEVFRYDATQNMFEASEGGRAREYGPGNRLQRIGDVDYLWDGEGRLVEKRRRRGDGAESWRYHYNGRGLLGAVECPDGREVRFDYDAFARRIGKRVYRRDDAADQVLETVCRYVWDGEYLAHEIKRTATAAGDPVVTERTFVFEDDGFTPLAERTVEKLGDTARGGDWYHFVNDPAGAPERLVTADGAVAADLGRAVWGEVTPKAGARATSQIRFMGQYEDPETSLYYSRYRYYDPDAGRFISYDPLGIDAGPNSFVYAPNPFSWVDPFGLTHFATAQLFDSEAAFRAGEEPLATSRQFDSCMTPHQRGRIAAHPAGSAERRSETARMRARCHTERKICDPPNGFGRRGPGSLGEGQCLVITAESVDGSARRPPCSQCQGAMIRLSRDRGGTVIYRPGMGGRMDRPFIVRNGVVEARG